MTTKWKCLVAVAAFVATSLSASPAAKVKILHKGKVIEVSENALKAHLGHGDERMIQYKGVWMTVSPAAAAAEAEYQDYQDGTVEEESEEDEAVDEAG